jgi:CheY-like chemotaxis protein
VRIRLPLKVEKIQAETGALRGKRLLVVEQDEKRREIYAKYLGEFNLEHTVVSAMPEALSALTEADFRQQPYHLVLIGGMKEGSARMLDLAAYLHESWPGVTLVLISEDDWPRIEYRANRAGVRHFIPVPVFRKTLVNGLNAALEGEADESSSAGSPNLEGKRILLVEDNAINREIAVEVLKMTNAAVDTAENGREGADRFLSSPEGTYDLILMDIQMPVLDGYGAVRMIRSSARADAAGIPIYAMTANTFAEDVARAREAGMNGHIAKPLDIGTLMHVLRKELN